MYMTFIFLYKSLPPSLASVACTPARRLSLYLCIHSYITWQCRKSRVRSCAAATARLVEKGNTTPARRKMCIERESLKDVRRVLSRAVLILQQGHPLGIKIAQTFEYRLLTILVIISFVCLIAPSFSRKRRSA